MTGCSYCGRPGCGYDECPERLEDRHGVPSDYDPENEGELKTDGGVETSFCDCGPCDNESVGGGRCVECETAGCGPEPRCVPMADGGTCRDGTDHWAVENGHHLAVTKCGKYETVPKEWRCRGCGQRFESKNLDSCPEPTVWVQLGAPGDGVGRCCDCEALFVFERDETPALERECPECGSLDWYRTDETEPDPEGVLRL